MQAPHISLSGKKSIALTWGQAYQEQGATAIDDVDGSVPVTPRGQVNSEQPGNYTITYRAVDQRGNRAFAYRDITVLEKVKLEYEARGHYLVGRVKVGLSESASGYFTLHVQRHIKNQEQWTNEPLLLENGDDAEAIFIKSAQRFQAFYQDMINRGMPQEQLQQMLGAITGPNTDAGVFIETHLGVCGYSGAPSKLTCGPTAHWSTIAHESMHGWHWGEVEDPRDDKGSILIQDIFTKWANYVYHTRQSEPEKLQGRSNVGQWQLDYLNYGLQNDAEWLAETFAGWLYGTTHVNSALWKAIKQGPPEFQMFFDCLWAEGKPLDTCVTQAFGSLDIKHPQYWPTDTTVSVPGFSREDTQAIWSVCTNADDKAVHTRRFNQIVRTVAPNLPGSPADHYSLGFGDCNHDGTTDWICTYTGAGPTGVGNGQYLWNGENKQGAYAFIIGGKRSDTYAEYKQDPYSTLPSMNRGALAQPWYREWQGEYGSCNGASVFKHRKKLWTDEYLKDIRR